MSTNDPLAARLVHLLPPATQVGTTAATRAHYDLLRDRLVGRIELIDAIRTRFPLLPEPPARATLQELVQAGRRALREDRATADTAELQATLALVDRFRNGLAP